MSDYIKYDTPARTRALNLIEKDRGHTTTEKERQEALIWAILAIAEEQSKISKLLEDLLAEYEIDK